MRINKLYITTITRKKRNTISETKVGFTDLCTSNSIGQYKANCTAHSETVISQRQFS